MLVKNYGPRTTPRRRHYCPHFQVAVREPTPLERLDIRCPEDTVGADCGTKTHLVVSSGHCAQHQCGGHRHNKKRKHQRHIAGKPCNSKRRRHACCRRRGAVTTLRPAPRPRDAPPDPGHPAGRSIQVGGGRKSKAHQPVAPPFRLARTLPRNANSTGVRHIYPTRLRRTRPAPRR